MASKPASKPLFSLPVLLTAALAIAIGAGVWYLERGSAQSAQGPVLTADAKAYVRNLGLSGVSMKATENAIHQAVI